MIKQWIGGPIPAAPDHPSNLHVAHHRHGRHRTGTAHAGLGGFHRWKMVIFWFYHVPYIYIYIYTRIYIYTIYLYTVQYWTDDGDLYLFWSSTDINMTSSQVFSRWVPWMKQRSHCWVTWTKLPKTNWCWTWEKLNYMWNITFNSNVR